MSSFEQRFKELRLESGLSLREIAEKCGFSKSAAHLYEIGKRKPKREALEELSCLFNVDIDYLLGKSDIKNKVANSLGYASLSEAIAAGVNIDEALKKLPEEPKLLEGEKELLQLIRLMPAEMKALYIETLRATLKSLGLIQ